MAENRSGEGLYGEGTWRKIECRIPLQLPFHRFRQVINTVAFPPKKEGVGKGWRVLKLRTERHTARPVPSCIHRILLGLGCGSDVSPKSP